IKMAQGSKPGEGGQLPGHKVTAEIARLRHTEPGVILISPPPHHDIYSIEDLAQLIYDLKTFKPRARVSVKLVSEPGVGVVAVGVAKAHADAVLVSGNEGGTGASPLTSVKHAGSPWEIGLAEAHQSLAQSGLRERVILETDGGLRTGRDVVVAAILGAERFGFGTLPLLALGCKMVRQCHENTCPVGIATQREDLRAKFTGGSEMVVTLFRLLAGEIREHLAALGARSIDEIIGRTDLLRPVDPDHPVAATVDALLSPVEARYEAKRFHRVAPSVLGEVLASDGRQAVAAGTHVEMAYPIGNTDRAVGTRLSGMIAETHPDGLPEGTVEISLAGTAGQSLGAFLSAGISIHLNGTSNDFVGKGMGGGRIAIIPIVGSDAVPHGAGNACLYGATGGHLFVAGTVGQRFAVRNSGAVAVVEGCSDHGCEYMTGGAVAVLGPVGRNFAAGMTGGVAYVYDPAGVMPRHLAETAPSAIRPNDDDLAEAHILVKAHLAATGSAAAADALKLWGDAANSWWVLRASARETTAVAIAAAATPR
ncbi:glutamate synthase subunit alpha, partial [bacterium]|nr:glutamate synthase subunit alpha [bacterium]